MGNEALTLLIFIVQMPILYLITRVSIKELFRVLKSSVLISIIFFPGTVLHELSHYLMATALLLKVRDVQLFPVKSGDHIRLGSVSYEKQDFARGIAVGIAPIFTGLLFFWLTARNNLFPADGLMMNLLFGYLIFVISSTMFSSRQDLVDLLYIIPLTIIVAGALYIFNIDIIPIFFNNQVIRILETINFYLFLSIVINLGIIGIFKFIKK